mmetsp:Transcript_30779/g.91472  ORF Transcript_30779/g.91472 Transcript_30779/m.91472 type:complete len:252 (-) Transcript_30779:1835-2590(-)
MRRRGLVQLWCGATDPCGNAHGRDVPPGDRHAGGGPVHRPPGGARHAGRHDGAVQDGAQPGGARARAAHSAVPRLPAPHRRVFHTHGLGQHRQRHGAAGTLPHGRHCALHGHCRSVQGCFVGESTGVTFLHGSSSVWSPGLQGKPSCMPPDTTRLLPTALPPDNTRLLPTALPPHGVILLSAFRTRSQLYTTACLLLRLHRHVQGRQPGGNAHACELALQPFRRPVRRAQGPKSRHCRRQLHRRKRRRVVR